MFLACVQFCEWLQFSNAWSTLPSIQLQIFTRGPKVHDVKAVVEPLNCASDELTAFVMHVMNCAGVKRKPIWDKFIPFVVPDLIAYYYQLNTATGNIVVAIVGKDKL
jgi:hypothetical protein